MKTVYLASGSPRRTELLDQICVEHQIIRPSVDETPAEDESLLDYVRRLAEEKAMAGYDMLENPHDVLVVGADTAGELNGEMLLQPKDEADGKALLAKMSGKTHQIYSAVAVTNGEATMSLVSVSEVTFASLSKAQIDAYWQTGEPADKAGAYGIQGIAAQFVQHMQGSYSGIVGLPLHETVVLLKEFGVEPL